MKRGKTDGKKSLAAVLAEFRFDLRPQTVRSSGGEAGTEAQTPKRGEKVITLPLLLICDRWRASGAEAEANRRLNCDFVSAALRRDLLLSEKKRKRGRIAGSRAVATIRETPPPHLSSARVVVVRSLCHMAPWLR